MAERQEQLDENPELIPSVTEDIVPVEIREPNRHRGLSDTEEQELKDRALVLVSELAEADGSRVLELADSVTSLGTQTQRRAGTELELLRGRVGRMLAGDGSGEQIFNNLVELRRTLDQINPDQLTAPGLARRVVSMVPLVGNPAVKALERIAVRYEPMSQQVSLIETRLREGRTMLARDNVELRMLYKQVEEHQVPIQKNAYLGELVMQHLSDLLQRTEDPLKQERIRNVLSDVAVRVGDLRAMEAVHIQFFVAIEMTRQNNSRLGQSVERTLALSSNVVHIGLAIRMALIHQERVHKANVETREFLGNLVEANADSVRRHTQQIGNIYNNPVIAIEKITQAHNHLMEAMDTADRLKEEGVRVARENIVALNRLSAELAQRSQGLRREVSETPSVEA